MRTGEEQHLHERLRGMAQKTCPGRLLVCPGPGLWQSSVQCCAGCELSEQKHACATSALGACLSALGQDCGRAACCVAPGVS